MLGSQTILVIALIGLLALLLAWKYKFRKPRSSNSDKKIQQIKFWRKVNEDSGLNVTLIESSSGWQLLDEADASGNGVVTVYGGPGKPTKTMRCYSMVRKSATIYNRQTYQPMKTECVKRFSVVKDDFTGEFEQLLTVSQLPRPGFEGILDYLKQNQLINF